VATANEYVAKAMTALALLTGRGDHSLSLVLATPLEREGSEAIEQSRRALAAAGRRLAPSADALSRGEAGLQ
jgi:hypothetical protein